LETAASEEKIAGMLRLFHDCGVDAWVRELKDKYREAAVQSLEDIAVLSVRKEPLRELIDLLLQREY
jgi:geranylgeranyl diphosphate synthase type II